MKQNNLTFKIVIASVCGVLLFAAAVFGFGLVEDLVDRLDSEAKDRNNEAFSYSDYSGEHVYYNGAYYAPKKNLETLLVLGIDTSEDRPNSTQSDFLALLILDKDQKSFNILYINRDTMAEIPKIDRYGDAYSSEFAQLALAHTYGADDRARCRNTVNAIETLLYDIKIDHFFSLTMDAVPALNDSVGGVTVQLLEDFTFLDESYVEGAVVTLRGKDALAYVRERGALQDSSNLSRMERQQQYISSFFDQFCAIEENTSLDTLLDVNRYLASDCTLDQLSKLLERMKSYTNNGYESLKGEAVVGAEFMEYYLDEQATRETVIRLFYTPIEK